jgi:hypothetical protein
LRRPDLLAHLTADKEARTLLEEFRREHFERSQAEENEPERTRDPAQKN